MNRDFSLARAKRRTFVALMAAAAMSGPSAAQATPLSVSLVDRDSGTVLPLYAKAGRSFAPGRPGARYAIRLSNQSAERIMVVLSVDGVNVVSGETARWDQVGYVLSPWQSADVTGWRKSDTQVAAFEFAALRDSYAARTGRPGHVGVIGAAVFQEALPPPVMEMSQPQAASQDRAEAERAAPAGAAKSAAPSRERLGTAHGQRETSVVSQTEFERRTPTPLRVQQIWYDSVPNLIAAGVMPPPRVAVAPSVPDAFPGSTGYVPDPPVRR